MSSEVETDNFVSDNFVADNNDLGNPENTNTKKRGRPKKEKTGSTETTLGKIQQVRDNSVWKPFLRQEQFISLPFTIFEALYGGAAGGGKTDTLLMLPLCYKFYEHPRFKGIIFRRTYKELELEVIVRSQQIYPTFGATYNKNNKQWIFPSGASLWFGHAEHEEDKRKYDSAQFQFAGFDELTSFPESIYSYIAYSRMRTADTNLPIIVRSATNPGNVGHTWVRNKFILPCPDGGKIIKDMKTGLSRIFIPSQVSDNPYIDSDYVKRLNMLPHAERQAKLYGDWFSFTGQVFTNFRSEPLIGDPDHYRHVVEPFNIPPYWPKFIAIDWGYSANTAVLWAALSPQGQVFIYREFQINKTDISTWAKIVRDMTPQTEVIQQVYICKSAFQNTGRASIAQLFKEFSGFNPIPTDNSRNSRVPGKILIQEGLLIPDYEITGRSLSNPNGRLYPKIQIFNSCKKLIDIIPQCIYDKNNTEDVMEFQGDDMYDCFRYIIAAANNYTKAVGAVPEQSFYGSSGGIISKSIVSGNENSARPGIQIYRRGR